MKRKVASEEKKYIRIVGRARRVKGDSPMNYYVHISDILRIQHILCFPNTKVFFIRIFHKHARIEFAKIISHSEQTTT